MAVRIAFLLVLSSFAVLVVTGSHAWFVATELGAVALIAARAVTVRRNRPVWTLAAIGMALWVTGGVVWEAGLRSLSVVMFAAMFVCEGGGLCLFLRGRIRPFPLWLAVDGVLAAFALAALGGLAYGPLRAATHSDPYVVAGLLANLVCDLLLLALVLVGIAATSGRPGGAWWLAGLGLLASATGDVLVPFHGVTSSLVELPWATSTVLIAAASWQPTPEPTRTRVGWATAALPLAGSAIAIGIVLYCGMVGEQLLATVLAVGALLAALGRAVLMLRENFALLHTARREALTDKLTGLPNRRALLLRLERALTAKRPHTLAFFDLDGFKAYNDGLGHAAGDALLQRLALRLAAAGGDAFRLGGDEFCLLIPGTLDDDSPEILGAVTALSEDGDEFSISASHGLVTLPDEVSAAEEALQRADERMYTRKRRRRRRSEGGPARDVLAQVLAERGVEAGLANELVGAFGQRLARAGVGELEPPFVANLSASCRTLTQLCQGAATLAASGRADDQRSG